MKCCDARKIFGVEEFSIKLFILNRCNTNIQKQVVETATSDFTTNYLNSLLMRAPDHVTPMVAVRLAIIAGLKTQAY
jgi:hypothetical protein